ncbi:uncharacterized protein EAE98_012449 [Botrytis deweyae]|uniref:RING-type domain-containing protein n=1 Tax=Botrytis deweyae TaxID=2478750 RepID=A0ABQ7I310_9HELO|nr:uncharacterized protein EAE98_012449 [Botrytis deweyae]KAF7908891.1 hypothetical protein EAE98_012449 [Botrytis deweyae]
MNCYAKLKDIDKLEKFIKSPGDLKFDLETAITMCRQGGYYEQAAYLAKKHGEHELVVDILIEDSKRYPEALQYIWRLDPDAAYPILMKYARVLLGHCPKDTTQVFIDYYTGSYRPMKDVVITSEAPVQHAGYAAGAAGAAAMFNATPADGQVTEDLEPPPPAYSPPQPRTAFSSFVDHPEEFIVFLEACLKEPGLKERDKIDLYTTLFEMYLHKSNEKNGRDREEWEGKAKKLIEGEDIPIDISNVLLLSHLSDFKDGTTLVREQAGLRFDIFRSYAAAKDTRGAIKALRKPRILEEAGDELDAVLEKIDADGLMAPLQTIERERKEIATNRRTITSYRTDTESKRQEINELSSKPQTFNATRCSFCSTQLDLPTVHFLCKHSFHQRCLKNDDEGNVEGDCPTCKKENDTIKAIRRGQEETAERHDLFLDMLGRSGDKFGMVAEFFGRGVMEVPGVE